MSWVWIELPVAQAVHDRQLAEHGGADGVRDQGALESALARPQNLAVYGKPDGAALAAAYAFGIARNHPFIDGNKRTAWVVARLFLAANGITFEFGREEAIETMLALAAGRLSEDELAGWFRKRVA
jgi:death-on-curing protein